MNEVTFLFPFVFAIAGGYLCEVSINRTLSNK